MLEISDYIHRSYLNTMYLRMYSYVIHLILDQNSWPKVGYDTILPPQVKRQCNRPKMSKRKSADEGPNLRAYAIKCCKCKKYWRNQRTCKILKKTSIVVTDEVCIKTKLLLLLLIYIHIYFFIHV